MLIWWGRDTVRGPLIFGVKRICATIGIWQPS
jgi:hypothetical protein